MPGSRRLVLAAALLGVACGKDAIGPQPQRLAVSPSSRMLSVRDDSLSVSADSASVTLSGADASTARWIVTHSDSATWVTLATVSGTGTGMVRWTRNTTGLWEGLFVDTITVSLQTGDRASVRLVDTVSVRSAPTRYITLRRAWRPGEKDSMAVAIVQRRAWDFPMVGDISDLAPAAIAQWDSAWEVIENPEWRPPAAPANREGFQYDATFSTLGLDLLIVFDAYPDSAGIQRDSLAWKMILWYKGTEPTWHGYIVRATTLTTWNPPATVDTGTFNLNEGKSGVAAGEARMSTPTYWLGSSGTYKLPTNGPYVTYSPITSGPFTGGNVATATMSATIKSLRMDRVFGTDLPNPQSWGATWTIGSQGIRCYYTPITPPSGFTSCTGSAFASIVAAARTRNAAAMAALRRPSRR